MPFAAPGADVTLSWDPSSDPSVVGYNVYYGIVSHVYTDKISVGDVTTATISNLVAGETYYFAVTAYDDLGDESDFSNETSFAIPLNPTNQLPVLTSVKNSNGQFSFDLSGTAGDSYVIEASTNLIDWQPVSTNVAPFTFTIPISSQYSQQFFRATYSTTSNPANIPATLSSSKQINGQFSFTVSGVAGCKYIVEASTNLIDWVQVATNLSPFTFTATDTAQFPQRFFRAVYLP